MNEGGGTVVADSSGNNVNGTLVGTSVAWVAGAPFAGSNAAPVAVDDTATTTEGNAVTIALARERQRCGRRSADADVGDGRLAAPRTARRRSMRTERRRIRRPAASAAATASATRSATARAASATATVSVTVTGVNDAPSRRERQLQHGRETWRSIVRCARRARQRHRSGRRHPDGVRRHRNAPRRPDAERQRRLHLHAGARTTADRTASPTWPTTAKRARAWPR